jgi:arsenate reductase
MAAAFFNALAKPMQARAFSAGTTPAEHVHPEVVTVMRERGFDLTTVRPRHLTDVLTESPQILITMGCGDACPVLPGVQRDDWPLADPQGQSLDQVRAICTAIQQRVAHFVAAHGWDA